MKIIINRFHFLFVSLACSSYWRILNDILNSLSCSNSFISFSLSPPPCCFNVSFEAEDNFL